ncbi:MAG: DNA starvation/stationary phase protection protein Dps [Meiothermus sp.]|uniref:DNA starvation/stationary phase protection protein Dps n=1 Tax=Meiothermus sp. TaxID=1955249 RepID=UPI0025EA3F35|nr:DNA starvation/stationary phase protection protein Dps [Meiothermus sp.]MCS7058076.1 DNA starvation/stationary phase protection protein Dps [Meiothermus sp.]MCS7194041.1 DNA starvation/stationary phase protection protein Dps [Meiothermus sp.]MCX7740299.1 DNA starvation/stationary phase protection protein Dps [Meiothermus sp.]MDW8091183.1 DNA starvation/stationary phase protection protein Dps [Meiothermus sp.]MDW8480440.1 DNA starvation/stationary phase protection protein Dps [Meiothermus sp
MALKARTKTPLHPTQNDLPEKTRTAVIEALAPALAAAMDLYAQAKSAHWNVKGPSFISLHELFDRVAEAADGWADLLAERIVQLGGTAEGTAQVVVERSSLPPYPLEITQGSEHTAALSRSLAAFGQQVRALIDHTDSLGDKDTADICTEISRACDKLLWFVEAHNA